MGTSTHTQTHTLCLNTQMLFFPFKQAAMSLMSVASKAVIYLFNNNRDRANRWELNE